MVRRKHNKETREESHERIEKEYKEYEKKCEYVTGSFEIFTPYPEDITKSRETFTTTVVNIKENEKFPYKHMFNVDVTGYDEDGMRMRRLKKWLDHHFRAFRKGVMFINAKVIEQYDGTKIMRFNILVKPRFRHILVGGKRIGD